MQLPVCFVSLNETVRKMLEKLLNQTGPVRKLLGISENGKALDLSAFDWEDSFEVVRGVIFNNVEIKGVEISSNFVECKFVDCSFDTIDSNGHFSAAGNSWYDCKFNKVKITDMIAPQSRFVGCKFKNSEFLGMALCQTLFDSCDFSNCSISGIKSHRVGNKSLMIPELTDIQAYALFRNCRFDDSLFKGCQFSDIRFEQCETNNLEFVGCDFKNTLGPDKWWHSIKSSDPFDEFLKTIIEQIEIKLGDQSRALYRLSEFAKQYRESEFKNKDYSACLYEGDVSDEELDAIDEILENAEIAFSI